MAKPKLFKAFTIAELTVVIAIIAVLASIIGVIYVGITANVRDEAVVSDANTIMTAEKAYAFNKNAIGKAWYSPNGTDSDLNVTLSSGNVADVVLSTSGYCIRVYNPDSTSYKGLDTAYKMESVSGTCTSKPPSLSALSLQIVTSGLILYLDAAYSYSYPGSGNTWYDLSGNNNDFTMNGSLSYSSTQGFSGFTQTNRWFRNSFPSNLKTSQGGNGYTTCVWAKSNAIVSRYQKLIGNGDEQNYIDLYSSITSGYYYQEDGSTLYYNSAVSVASNTFLISDGIWRMYSSTNSNSGKLTNPTDAFGIGSEGDAAYNYPWNGNVASVMIYNRVLSSAEISQNFNALRTNFGV